MLRWLATVSILGLLALDLSLPYLPMGRRGPDTRVRAEVDTAVGVLGEALPQLELLDLEGRPLSLADMRGHPLIITFERSVDW